ncbi:MAG: PAS domain-containing protein [Myxococcales bacterium]|nr:PAS domain-containing protein [Myxococcales bacterium]MCB9537272.1 PAS domain-containing protein [Myxococcales bacterium]
MAAVFEHMLAGFAYHRIVTDDAGRPVDYVYLAANPAFARLTGLDGARLIGRRVTELLPGIEDDPGDWIGTFGRVAQGGEPLRFVQYSTSLGRWYQVVAFSPAPDHFAVTFDDVTALKESEQARDRLIADLERKNAELERFTYTASHELRTPLVTIQGFVDVLEEDLAAGDGAAAADDLDRVRRAAARMRTLLDELLELARLGHGIGARRSTRFGDLVEAACETVYPQLGDVLLEVAGRDVTVWGDPERLIEVLRNLLDNAAKFSASRVHRRVAVRATRAPSGGTLIRVADNGVGLDPAFADRVFRLFERLDPSLPGTGVGLAIVRRVVELHGGSVALRSRGIGEGCVVEIELPGEGSDR